MSSTAKAPKRITCWNCSGHGIVASYDMDGFMSPDECATCGGSGTVIQYPSGVLAKWPGGPLLGRVSNAEPSP